MFEGDAMKDNAAAEIYEEAAVVIVNDEEENTVG